MTVVCCTKCGIFKDSSRFDRMTARKNGLRPDCKDCRKPIYKAYQQANTEKINSKQEAWRQKNPDKVRANQRRHREKNIDLHRERVRHWQKQHRAEDAARSAAQRAVEKRATPAWANKSYITLFYKIAKLEEERTGFKVHVDHIFPLNSPLVCGLHVEDNLQLLFARDNIVKKNRLIKQNGGGLSL